MQSPWRCRRPVPRAWLTDRGMMEVNGCLQSPHAAEVFAIGDTVQPGLLTHAIGQGADVAVQVDAFLAGQGLEPNRHPEVIPVSCLSKELFRPQNRGRVCSTDALAEAGRCLSCGTCRDCSMCLEACPEGLSAAWRTPTAPSGTSPTTTSASVAASVAASARAGSGRWM